MALVESHAEIDEKGGASVDVIEILEEPCYLFDHDPIYCSLERLRLQVGGEKTGLYLANNFFSVVSAAHLYNATRQKGVVTIP